VSIKPRDLISHEVMAARTPALFMSVTFLEIRGLKGTVSSNIQIFCFFGNENHVGFLCGDEDVWWNGGGVARYVREDVKLGSLSQAVKCFPIILLLSLAS